MKTGTDQKKRLSGKQISKTVFLTCMLLYPLAQFLVFYVYMNFNNIIMAFQGMKPDGSTYWNGLENFKLVFIGIDSLLIRISFWNNLKMFVLTLVIGMPLNILFGYYLYKKKFASSVIRTVYMLPNMVSGVVMTLLFMQFMEVGFPQMMQETLGIQIPNLIRNNNTAFGVQVFYTLWLGFSSSIIIYSNAMFSIDESVIEASKIDGATTWQELTRIVVPLIFPTLTTYLITGVAGIFTVAGSLYLFYGLNDVPRNTYMMGFYLFKIAMAGDLTAYPMGAAVSIVITVVTVPLTLATRWLLNRIDPMREVYGDIA